MAEAIVSVVLEQLMKVAGGQIQQEVKLVKGVDDEIKKLTSNFQTIQAVLADAEQRQVTEAAVSLWLDKLKDVSYEMDDVLDEWNTAIMKRLQTEGAENAHSTRRKVRSFILFPYSGLKQVVLSHDIASKIKAINDNLDAIAKERDRYNFKSIKPPHQRDESTSFVDVSEVVGRDEQNNALVGKLLSESCEEGNGLHVISIVGMGGIGKTTLAQLAYNNDEVIKHFEKRIWVSVSDPFDKLRTAKAILETLEGRAFDLSTLQSLLEKISELLRRKKFLIVLDDVWTENDKDWEPFHHCLKNGLHGSKVLVTTRKQTTALIMKSIDKISIEELSEEHCWLLFRQLAFFGRSDQECEKLKKMGRKIVSKCKGLPLAAKTMGSLLRFKTTEKEWESILDSEMWKLEEFEEGVFPPLLLSYYDLPSMVKRCFTYCAIFPKDFKFKKDELIKLWMAQDYLGLDHNEDIEIIGEKHFNSLAMRSFFQEFEKDDDGNIIRCKMHDIVHDVAQFLSKNECCMIEVKDLREWNKNVLCEKARQLRLMNTEKDTSLISICNFKKLRSLLIEYDGVDRKLIGKVELLKLFNELTCLKALGISGEVNIKHIPKEIGKLIHLRYLALSNTENLIGLPETLCELYNLQTLKLNSCTSLKVLPQGIGKLIHLRYLYLSYTMNLIELPETLCELYNLQTLKLDGCRSLKVLPQGIGKLIHLRYLDLSSTWQLIELPETLCELYNLQTLKLDKCTCLKELPQGIGKLINLRHLMNWGTNSLRYMPKGMERLTHLRTLNEFHLNSGDYGGKTCSLEFLNNLGHIESLWIKGLKNLAKVTGEIVQLKNNKNIRDLGLGFPRSDSMNNDDEAILEAFQPPPNLQELTIEYYGGPTMSTLRRMTSLTNLRSLKLSHCTKCLHMPPLGKLPSLETLHIEEMISVREVGNEFLGLESGEASSSSSSIIYFPKLKTLRFWRMRECEVWDFGNEDDTCTIMPSLRSLDIEDCDKLKGLPKQLLQMAPLQYLEIGDCSILEDVYEKWYGAKWQDISHIPNIDITGASTRWLEK